MKSHKNGSKSFEELSYKEQSSAINIKIVNLESMIKAHIRKASTEERKVDETIEMIKNQINNMIDRL